MNYIISFLTYFLHVWIILYAVSLLDPFECDLVAQWRLISLLLYTRYYFTFVASFCVKVKCVLAALTHRQCTDSNFVMEERVKSSLLLYTKLLLYYCPSRLALHVQFVICEARSNRFMSLLCTRHVWFLTVSSAVVLYVAFLLLVVVISPDPFRLVLFDLSNPPLDKWYFCLFF